jgi:hypothetical protein
VWAKSRSLSYSHNLYDTVRGTGKGLYSDSTGAESTNNIYGYISAFNSDGFTATPGSTDNGFFNETNATYAAWCWDAGSSTVTNTQGSISSQVRANASAGFSVITYTGNGTAGATVGHGLNVAPQLLINKRRSSTGTTADWAVWHKSVADISGSSYVLFLNTTDAALSASNRFNSTAPTSSVFTLGNADATNYNGGTFVTYCFAPVAGYASMGSFVANANSDGPFVYTSFKPRLVLCKLSSASGADWLIFDTARSPYNVVQANLRPNTSGAEESAFARIDILSNGFKVRAGSGVEPNGTNGNTYIYAAWAESPFNYSRAA